MAINFQYTFGGLGNRRVLGLDLAEVVVGLAVEDRLA
jgi:hypothetical protein